MVGDGDSFGVGGHHFARLPIALLRAIAERGAEGPPLRLLGGRPAARDAARGGRSSRASTSASRASTSSACRRASAPPPKPATVPVRDWTALAMIQALRAGEANLPSLPFQLPAGSDMMERVPGAITASDPISGEPVGVIPAASARHGRPPRAARRRARQCRNLRRPRARLADGRRRAEGAGHRRGDRAGGHAAAGRPPSILTRNRVSAIAEVAGGAWPTSCLPFYVTDYAALPRCLRLARAAPRRLCACPTPACPSSCATLHVSRCRYRAVHPSPSRSSIQPVPRPLSIDEIMAVRIAAELDNDSFACAGAVSPLANVAYRLAKARTRRT